MGLYTNSTCRNASYEITTLWREHKRVYYYNCNYYYTYLHSLYTYIHACIMFITALRQKMKESDGTETQTNTTRIIHNATELNLLNTIDFITYET